VSNELLTADVQRVLARRANQAGRVEKLATIPDTVFMPSILQEIDEATMSAAFVISTADVDRSGDKVETAGIRLEHHRANPVVLWDHGKGPIGKLPIGKCQDDAGNYTVVIRPEEGVAVARIFFAKDLPFAKDIFLLVKGGYLRGSSMGFLPLRAAIMPGADPSDECPPLHLLETDLCEVSVTAVPDNPRALKIAMEKSLESRFVSSEIKMLQKDWEESKHKRDADGKFGSGAASAKAGESSKKATGSGSKDDHKAAAAAHYEAAAAHEKAGNSKEYAHHKQQEEHHVNALKEHARQSSNRADDSSKKASASGSAEAHEEAAKSHQEASRNHREFGDEGQRIAHSEQARKHQDIASNIRLRDKTEGEIGGSVKNAASAAKKAEDGAKLAQSSDAAKASKKATKDGTAESHSGAAKAHEAAAKAHQDAADQWKGRESPAARDLQQKHQAAASAHAVAASKHRTMATAIAGSNMKEKSMKNRVNQRFADDYERLGVTGKAKINKALAEITGKAADDYLPLDEEGKVTDDAMNTGAVADGAAVTPVETPPVETVSVDAVAEDTPAWKQPLDGPPSQAAATDIHTRLLDVADAIEGWSSRQENQTFKPILDELAEAIKEKAGSLSSFHDEEHPDAPPLGVGDMDADVDVDDLDDDEDEVPDPDADPDEVKEKAARKLRIKTVKEWRTKRLNNLRGKRMGPQLITKGLSKRVSGICTKAATFLEKAEEHDGEWSETHKAASGYHGKALRELCKAGEAIADAAGDDDAMKTKAIKDKLAATEAELVKHKDAATKWMKIAGSFKKACDKLKNKAR
jgi:hypothetical protein